MTDTLHEDQYTCFTISRSILLRIKNISDKICRENQNTRFVFSNLLKCCVFDVEKYGGARQVTGSIIWRKRFACWINKAADTHSYYQILTAFPRQKWLRERSSILRLYVHWDSSTKHEDLEKNSERNKKTCIKFCRIFCEFLIGPIHATCPVNLVISAIVFKRNRILNVLIMQFLGNPPPPLRFLSLILKCFHQNLLSNTLDVLCYPILVQQVLRQFKLTHMVLRDFRCS